MFLKHNAIPRSKLELPFSICETNQLISICFNKCHNSACIYTGTRYEISLKSSSMQSDRKLKKKEREREREKEREREREREKETE